jgi:TRAP-type uncharacterized transport system substrate-binding protein
MNLIQQFIGFILLALSMTVPAQGLSLNICAGANADSVYTKMISDVVNQCSSGETKLVLKHSEGSVASVSELEAKRCDAGMIQGDIYSAYAKFDPNSIKGQVTIAGMHTEAYHFVSAPNLKTGMFSSRDIKSTDSLVGMKIGVTQSGSVSMRMFNNLIGGEGITPEVYASSGELVKALSEGKIASALFVTGVGSDTINNLPKALMLVPVSDAHRTALVKGGYVEEQVSYQGRTTGPMKTVSARAFLIGRSVGAGKYRAAMVALSACIKASVSDLQDSPTSNRAWKSVYTGSVANGTVAVK